MSRPFQKISALDKIEIAYREYSAHINCEGEDGTTGPANIEGHLIMAQTCSKSRKFGRLSTLPEPQSLALRSHTLCTSIYAYQPMDYQSLFHITNTNCFITFFSCVILISLTQFTDYNRCIQH